MIAAPLPRRVRHKDQETALSLALRLAQRHGEGWQAFSSATGLPVSPLRLSLSLDRLAALSGVERTRFEPWTPSWDGHRVAVLGHRMDRSRFLRLNLRVCPECMREDVEGRDAGERPEDAAYLRLEWCLAFVFGCARHGVRLVTRCPACGERPRWRVGRIDECHCGASLLVAPPEPMPDVERDLLGALLDRLHGRAVSSSLLADTRDVPLPDLVNLLRLLGEVGTGRAPADARACALEVDDLGHLMASGAQVVSRLPGSFERLLDRLAGEGDHAGRGWPDVYGLPLVRWMRSDRPFIDVMRPVFERHGLRRSLPARKSDADPPTRHAIDTERRRRFLTLGQMERLRRAARWDGPSPARRDEVLARLRPTGDLMLTREAADHFGIPWQCFRELREAGAITPSWENSGHLFFYGKELDALLADLRRGAPIRRTPPPGTCGVERLAKTRLAHVSSLLLELLRGELECDGVLAGAKGVSALLFRTDRSYPTRRRNPAGTILGGTLAHLIQLNGHHRRAADAAGLLALRKGGAPNAMTHCSPEAFAQFDAAFVSLARVARCLGENTQKVRRRLAASGVQCVLPVWQGGIFSRADVERVVGSGVVPLVPPPID